MSDQSIINPDYQENPELDYSNCSQYKRNIDMFLKTKRAVLQPSTRHIYEYVRNFCIDFVKSHPQYPKFIWKPKIADIGCGGGFGSNILSQEADFVWGIDADKESIQWANLVFKRNKNNIYYSPQISFENIDILNEPREIMAFDIVVCVEVIEHLNEYSKLLDFLKRLCKKNKDGSYLEPPNGTIIFISTPNRNNSKIGQAKPKSKRHVREWKPDELYAVLTKHFKYITLLNMDGEPQELSMTDSDMLFKCECPI